MEPDQKRHPAPWEVLPLEALVRRLLSQMEVPTKPRIIAIDGRGGAGKTYLASRIQQQVLLSAVVHTDDVAWHHSFFDWADLMSQGVLSPVREGKEVRYRPPGWINRNRPGEIHVPANLDLVLIEGTGAARQELQPWLDASIWVHSNPGTAAERLVQRDGNGEAEELLRQEWAAEEESFLLGYQPWKRAAAIIDGTSTLNHSENEVIAARTTA